MQLTSKQKKLAIAVMLGIGLLLALRLWMSGLADRAHGPAALSTWVNTAGEAQVWAFMDERFYQLSDQGRLLTSYPLSSFGLSAGITDFQVISESEILIGDPMGRQVLRCHLKTTTCKPLWPGNLELSGLFKFHMDVARNVLFVADNAAHQLFVYPLGGKSARAITLAGELRNPNSVWADARQTLWVADTNHHRIVGLRPEGKLTKPMYKLKARGEGVNASHTWPVALAMDEKQQMWGLFANGMLRNAELLLFGSDHQLIKSINFGSGADAVDVVALSNHVVVADRDGVALHKVSMDLHEVSPFGTSELQTVLQAVRKKQKIYGWVSLACLVLMVLLLGSAFWLARQVSREETAERQAYLAQHGVRVN